MSDDRLSGSALHVRTGEQREAKILPCGLLFAQCRLRHQLAIPAEVRWSEALQPLAW